jgi:[ribosomal protein S18]-alanine N-acetyltransferase
MQKVNIELCKIEDIINLVEMEKKYFSEPWSEKSFISEIQNKTSMILVVFLNEIIVGYIALSYVIDEVNINKIVVEENMRNMGIATLLLNEIELKLYNKIKYIHLEVRESNEPAKRLYLKNGYDIVGLRKNFYSLPTENAVLMTKIL